MTVPENEIYKLRRANYNATVKRFRRVHDELAVLRVAPDDEPAHFEAGQYTTLGLGYWEPRVAGSQAEAIDEARLRKMVRRAYSFSSPILDDDGHLAPPAACGFCEFYIVLIREGEEKPPGLTPRIFVLAEGERLHLGKKATGHYTLEPVQPTDHVLLIATGTGEAPHNAMTAELLARGHPGKIVVVTCVRRRRDLGYLETYRELARRYPQVNYSTLTTREPENLDSALPNYLGKRYLQQYFLSGALEEDAGIKLNPENWHVYLCGNPAMIGAPQRTPSGPAPPSPGGMVHALKQRGFPTGQSDEPSRVHFEKYW